MTEKRLISKKEKQANLIFRRLDKRNNINARIQQRS